MHKFKILILILCAVCGTTNARHIKSPLPLPEEKILNLSTTSCNVDCLNDLYNQNQIFSFIALASDNTSIDLNSDSNFILKSNLNAALSYLSGPKITPSVDQSQNFKLALLIPKNIANRYLSGIINTIISYLSTRGGVFAFEVFDSMDEGESNLNQTYDRIKNANYSYVIALLTKEGAKTLINSTKIMLPTYIPTVNLNTISDEVTNLSENLYFGGIDYEEQVSKLLDFSQDKRLIIYNDDSIIGEYLGNLVKDMGKEVALIEDISSQDAATFQSKARAQARIIKDSAIFLNTPIIKTSLMLSQLGFLRNKPAMFLSTQINFTSSLLSLVQARDRRHFYITSMINPINLDLLEYASLINADLRYNWVNYSAAIGVNRLYEIAHSLGEENNYFAEKIIDSQVKYINKLYEAKDGAFFEVPSSVEPTSVAP